MNTNLLITISVVLSFLSSNQILGQDKNHCTVYFAKDQSQLNEQSIKTINEFITSIQTEKEYSISIHGHTDHDGSHDYNHTLSEKRASAVHNYLLEKGLHHLNLLSFYYGETEPIKNNKHEQGKSLNRRVEIEVVYTEKERKREIELAHKKEKIKEEVIEKDTILYGKSGSMVTIPPCAFEPYPIEEVKFEIKEVFTIQDMLDNNVITVDDNGNCLRSGGMLYIKAFYNGKRLELNKGCPINIKIPTDNIYAGMKLYKEDSQKKWKEINQKVKVYTDTTSQKKYYETQIDQIVTNNASGGFNVDAPIYSPAVLPKAIIALVKNMVWHEGLVVKLKGRPHKGVLVSYDQFNSVSKGKKSRKNRYKYQFDEKCDMDPNNITLVLKQKKGKSERKVYTKLSNLKYSKMRNLYILKKKHTLLDYNSFAKR